MHCGPGEDIEEGIAVDDSPSVYAPVISVPMEAEMSGGDAATSEQVGADVMVRLIVQSTVSYAYTLCILDDGTHRARR